MLNLIKCMESNDIFNFNLFYYFNTQHHLFIQYLYLFFQIIIFSFDFIITIIKLSTFPYFYQLFNHIFPSLIFNSILDLAFKAKL